MINIIESITKGAILNAVYNRIIEYQVTCEHVDGSYKPAPGELTPQLKSVAYQRDYQRNLRNIKSAGERVLRTKIDAAVGTLIVNGEDSTRVALEEFDWMTLARTSLRQFLIAGMVAGYAYEDEETGVIGVSNLGEYIEPYLRKHDSSSVEGVYQAYQYLDDINGKPRWAVNIYDWTSQPGVTIRRSYLGLSKPTQLGGSSNEVNISPLRYRMDETSRDSEGVNQGILMTGVPLFNALITADLRLARALDYTANPMLRVNPESGQPPKQVGPSEVILAKDAEYLLPGNLNELREARDAAERRIARDLRMPASFVASLPSGEALREANLTFYQVASNHAAMLTDYLTELARDYLTLRNINDDTASIAIAENKVYLREIVMADAINLFRAGIIPLGVAAHMVQSHIDEFSENDLAEWKDANGTITPESLERLIQ